MTRDQEVADLAALQLRMGLMALGMTDVAATVTVNDAHVELEGRGVTLAELTQPHMLDALLWCATVGREVVDTVGHDSYVDVALSGRLS